MPVFAEGEVTGILSDVGDLVTQGISWMGDFLAEITADSSKILVTFVVAVPLVGLGVGLLKRLIHTRG